MNILITGGTGFIGRHLVDALLAKQHKIVLFCRDVDKACALFGDRVQYVYYFRDVTLPIDVVVNLAGEPIIDKRWTRKRRSQLRGSRIGLTQHLNKWISKAKVVPKVMISGSAIGYYGNHPEDASLGEDGSSRNCFPSRLCSEWEFEALKARSLGVRVCLLRTGVVLDANAGALQKMLTPFRLGLGGNVASGKQWFSWIHIEDMVNAIIFLMEQSDIEGAVNITAPEPVNYNTFTKMLAEKLSRPHFFPMPAFILKLIFGEASQLLIEGQRVVPSVLLTSGFAFRYGTLCKALDKILDKDLDK
ncbi:MAG: hypothetical protein ACJA0C_001492 [Candidatus Endobugula sp.]|jgi:uncharacterized protein (TIGR01777 family)